MAQVPAPLDAAADPALHEAVERVRASVARVIVGQKRSSTACSSPCSATATSSSKACPASPRRCREHARPDHRRQLCARAVHARPLPADVTGTQIYNPQDGDFHRAGPIFANIVLADEVNRAPAKVQSALLEAMQERQVSIGGNTFPLAGAVHGARDPEPDRVRGHLRPA